MKCSGGGRRRLIWTGNWRGSGSFHLRGDRCIDGVWYCHIMRLFPPRSRLFAFPLPLRRGNSHCRDCSHRLGALLTGRRWQSNCAGGRSYRTGPIDVVNDINICCNLPLSLQARIARHLSRLYGCWNWGRSGWQNL